MFKKVILFLLLILFLPVCVIAKTFNYSDINSFDYLLESTDKLDLETFPSWNNTFIYSYNGTEIYRDSYGYGKYVINLNSTNQYYKFDRLECRDSDCYGAFYYFNIVKPTTFESEGNIYISSINRVEKSEYAREKELPTFSGLSAEFNVFFNKLNDYIIYDINVVNDTKQDFALINKLNFKKSDYLKYEIIDNSDIIKSKTNKTVKLKISYIKEIEGGTFDESNKYNALLDNNLNNPVTKNNIIIIVTFLVLFLFSILFIKNRKVKYLITLFILFIPAFIYAIDSKELNINTHVSLVKTDEFCYGGYYTCGMQNPSCYEYIVGETFNDFINRTGSGIILDTEVSYTEGNTQHFSNPSDALNMVIKNSKYGYYLHCPS